MKLRTSNVWLLLAVSALVGLTAYAQEVGKASFPLAPVSPPSGATAIQLLQIERLNTAIEELAFVHQQFVKQEADAATVLAASERVNEARREALSRHSDQISFAARHFVVVEGIERELAARRETAKATEQEVRLAKLHRLEMQIELLRPASPQVGAAATPAENVAGGAPATPPVTGNVPATGRPPLGTVTRPLVIGIDIRPKPRLPLKEASPEVLAATQSRLIDTRVHGGISDFFMRDDGQTAVTIEPIDDQHTRYCLWNLNTGKVVRFLAAAEGKPVAPYAGKDDADFGVETAFDPRETKRASFSPDGKWIAALTSIAPVPPAERPTDEILVWDAATGELKQTIKTGANHHHHTFFFVDATHIATKAFGEAGVSIELIDVVTGSFDYLIKDVNFEMYGGAVHNDLVAFAAPRKEMLVINKKTLERIEFERAPAETSNFAADRTWFSPDGKLLFARKHEVVQTWDVATKKFLSEYRLGDDRALEMEGIAADAGLIARRKTADRTLELLNSQTHEVVTSLQWPFARVDLAGMSRDGKRMAIPNEKRQMLIVDFPAGMPTGVVSLSKASSDAIRKPASR